MESVLRIDYKIVRMFSFSLCQYNCGNNCNHEIHQLQSDNYESIVGIVVPTTLHKIQVADMNDQSISILLRIVPQLVIIKRIEQFCKKDILILVSYFHPQENSTCQNVFVSSATIYARKDCVDVKVLKIIDFLLNTHVQDLIKLDIFDQRTPSPNWNLKLCNLHQSLNHLEFQQEYIANMEINSKESIRFPLPDPKKKRNYWGVTVTLKGAIINSDDVFVTIQNFCHYINAHKYKHTEKTLIITNNDDSTKVWISCFSKSNKIICVNNIQDLNIESLKTANIVLVRSSFLYSIQYKEFIENILKEHNLESEEQLYEWSQRYQLCGLLPLSTLHWNRIIFQDILKYFKYLQNLKSLKNGTLTWFKSNFMWGITKYTKYHLDIVTIHRFVVALLQFCYGQVSMCNLELNLELNLACPTIRFLLKNCVFRFDYTEFVPCIDTSSSKNTNKTKITQMSIQPGEHETLLWNRLNLVLSPMLEEVFWLDPLHVVTQEDILKTNTAEQFYSQYIEPLSQNANKWQLKSLSNVAELQIIHTEMVKIVKYINTQHLQIMKEITTKLQQFVDIKSTCTQFRRVRNKEVNDLLTSLFQLQVDSIGEKLLVTKHDDTVLKDINSRIKFANHKWEETKPQICVICYDAPAVVCLSTCFHFFCKNCILKAEPNNVKTCPCCKTLCHASELVQINFNNVQETIINLHNFKKTFLTTLLIQEMSDFGINLIIFSTIYAARVCAHIMKRYYGSKVHLWKHHEQDIPTHCSIIITGLVKSFSLTMVLPHITKVIVFGGLKGQNLKFKDDKKTLQCQTLVSACSCASVKQLTLII